MSRLLDTNICVWLIRRRSPAALARLKAVAREGVALSTITLAELEFGAAKSSQPVLARQALERFCAPFDLLPFSASATRVYGQLRAYLEAQGKPIGPLDTLIAAQALAAGAILVTNNRREFARVPQLPVEDWLTPGP